MNQEKQEFRNANYIMKGFMFFNMLLGIAVWLLGAIIIMIIGINNDATALPGVVVLFTGWLYPLISYYLSTLFGYIGSNLKEKEKEENEGENNGN